MMTVAFHPRGRGKNSFRVTAQRQRLLKKLLFLKTHGVQPR